MAPANLVRAFNAFYQQNPEFPRPSPASDENSMAGLDPSCAGIGQGDILFCQLSPLHPITLDSETKSAANIPQSATSFAWAYPMVDPTQMPRGAAEAAFFQFGGYMYFDVHQTVVGTNSISPASIGTLGLMFGRPHVLSQNVADTLTKQGRFQEITLQSLSEKSATHFAWIRPAEFGKELANSDGCFAYKFADGSSRYFPVVSKPTFTKELLEEELDAEEAWVVVRNASDIPALEVPLIFDKTKTLEENLSTNAHALEVKTGNLRAIVSKESDPLDSWDGTLTYQDWCESTDQGTVADPWVITFQKQMVEAMLAL